MAVKILVFEGSGTSSQIVLPVLVNPLKPRINAFMHLELEKAQLYMDWVVRQPETSRGRYRCFLMGNQTDVRFDEALFITGTKTYEGVEKELQSCFNSAAMRQIGEHVQLHGVYPQALRGIPPTMKVVKSLDLPMAHYYYCNLNEIKEISAQARKAIVGRLST